MKKSKNIVPRYWADSKEKKVLENGKQFTIKRFGWSDISEADAKQHADLRLNEALGLLNQNGDVRRIDHKISYNGAEGIPIREQVIAKHNDVVISRNSYGALCLNTPDVMFADIDFDTTTSFNAYLVASAVPIIIGLSALYFKTWILWLCFVAILFFVSSFAEYAQRAFFNPKNGFEADTLERVSRVSSKHPDLNILLYRTTLGMRALIMNQTYDPSSEETNRLLGELNSDKTYIQMCKNQDCFRARVSPKPWRVGSKRLGPRPGVWPVADKWLDGRNRWVDEYDNLSQQYASCRFLMHVGSDTTHEKTEFVRKLHDDYSKAHSSHLTIA